MEARKSSKISRERETAEMTISKMIEEILRRERRSERETKFGILKVGNA